MSFSMYLALVHGPVRNKEGNEVTTSVTNLDIHDISRSARTYGFKNYFIVTPIPKQRELVGSIIGHWHENKGLLYNPDRSSALSIAELSMTLDEAKQKILEREGKKPLTVVTGANFDHYDGNSSDLGRKLQIDKEPLLLVFGTGWGLTASMCESADYRLEPLFGFNNDGYNHLSVRSAVAIYCSQIAETLREASGSI